MTTRSVVRTIVVAAAMSFALTGCQLHGKPHVARQVARVQASPSGAGSGATALAGASGDSSAIADVIAPGIVEPWGAQVDLAAREPGWIAGILVREGEVVRAGQPLAWLEDDAQRRALYVARAFLAEAEVAFENT